MKKSKNQLNGLTSQRMFAIRITTVILILLVFSSAKAQNNLSITFRPGANFPVKDMGATKLNNGGGFEATVAYKFIPNLAVYGGWGWNQFSEKESTADLKLQFEETGYTFGLQFIHPLCAESKLNFMIGAGGIYNHIETENNNGDIINDTGHGLGWQADAGLSIPIGHHNRWQIMPTVRYHALSRDMTISDGTQTTADLNYFSAGVGVIWTIWKVAE